MTLTRLLEIDIRLLRDGEDRGLSYAERVWCDLGEPADPRKLCEALEKILHCCVDEGIGYPAILLRRKKEVERGTWQPKTAPPTVAAQPTGGAACPDCGGKGFITRLGGASGSLCFSCRAWEHASKLKCDRVGP